jgi:hypothetical protein
MTPPDTAPDGDEPSHRPERDTLAPGTAPGTLA